MCRPVFRVVAVVFRGFLVVAVGHCLWFLRQTKKHMKAPLRERESKRKSKSSLCEGHRQIRCKLRCLLLFFLNNLSLKSDCHPLIRSLEKETDRCTPMAASALQGSRPLVHRIVGTGYRHQNPSIWEKDCFRDWVPRSPPHDLRYSES